MRRILSLLLLVSLTLAGCMGGSGGNDDGDGDSGTPAGGATNSTFEPVRLTHDFAMGADQEANFTIPGDGGVYDVLVYFTGPAGAPACAAPQARIVVADPEGGTFAGATGVGVTAGPSARCAGAVEELAANLTGGTWVVTFSGRGAVTGVVEVRSAQDAAGEGNMTR